ncbi:hypothetical protein C0J52_10648 [Blattella germanica]|nr:hypothetical protein C0J52_10648 [Blattella germanica]
MKQCPEGFHLVLGLPSECFSSRRPTLMKEFLDLLYIRAMFGLGMRMTMTLNPNGVGLEAALNKMVGNPSANQLAPSNSESAPCSSSTKSQL